MYIPSNYVIGKTNWRDPRSVAKAVKYLWDRRGLKDKLERRTARNIAFLEGRQNYEWDIKRRTMRIPPARQQTYHLIYNVIKPLIFQKLSKLSRNDPVWTVPSYTADEHDQMVARFSNDVLGWYWRDGLDMPAHLTEMLLWIFCSPVVWAEPFWDSTKGDVISTSLGEFLSDTPASEQQAMMQKFMSLNGFSGDGTDDHPYIVAQRTGDINFRIANVFKMMWYPFFVENWNQVHVYLKTEIVAPEFAATMFNLNIDEVLKKGVTSTEATNHYNKIMNGWSSPFVDNPTSLDLTNDHGVLIHQIYADPIAAPPYGAQGVVLGEADEAIAVGELGNAQKVLPFFPAVEHKTPGFAWGTCSVDDAICAQMEYNKTRTDQSEWRDTVLRPKIVRIKGDGAKPDQFTKKKTVIEVNGAEFKPDVLFMPSSGVEQAGDNSENLRYIHDAIGVPDVSLGRTGQTQARSGRAVLALQEESNERLRLNGNDLNRLLEQVGGFFLSELQAKAIDSRLTPLVGSANQIEYRAWSRATLRPSVYETNPSNCAIVRVTTFSNIPTTIAQMRQLILELTEMQYLRPGEHDQIVAEVFGLNDMRTVLDRDRQDRDKQEAEISRWRLGALVPPPSITDNDEAHILVLRKWLMSDEYAQLSQVAPLIAQQAYQHYQQHQQAIYDKQVRQQYAAQYANMRVAVEFANKALNESGRPDWAALFAAQAMGNVLAGAPMLGPPNPPPEDGQQNPMQQPNMFQQQPMQQQQQPQRTDNPNSQNVGASSERATPQPQVR